MNAHDAVIEMVDECGIPIRELYRRVGRFGGVLYSGRTPRADALARIANGCGYDMILRRRSDRYEIHIDEYDD